jgi:CheY-like chemotaxis protein
MYESEPLRGIRVLLVDNNDDSRDLYAYVLGSAGAEVTALSSISESFAAFEQTRPHVVVADLGRPGDVGGASLVEWIRSREFEEGGETPAIAVTGYARPQDRARAIGSGFDQCLAKPVSPRDVLSVVARLVGADLASH